jgi:dolichol-phosphate mannosyltransferase
LKKLRLIPVDKEKTLIIVPTFNEAGNIAELHARIRKYSPDSGILFVDDGSIDGTREIINGIIKGDEKVHILERR